MRAAEARRAASISSSNSSMFSAGGFVDCTTKMSAPRMFSSIRTKISPSANRVEVTLHTSDPRCRAISATSGTFALPHRILKPRDADCPSMRRILDDGDEGRAGWARRPEVKLPPNGGSRSS